MPRDFDDAVNVEIDAATRHWLLTVHIADVAHFVSLGGHLDREARKRGNSVYLPQQVIPMFPEVISNGLASLQEGKLRYVKSAQIEFTPRGQVVSTRFSNGAIRVRNEPDCVELFEQRLLDAGVMDRAELAKVHADALAEVDHVAEQVA